MQLSLNKLPWYAQIGGFVVISLAALGSFYNFYVLPANAELATQQETLNKLRADVDRGVASARKLPELQAEIGDLEARLESLRAVLPEQKDVGDLLRRIQTLATQSNLQIKGFKPQPIANKQLHAEWPITLQLDGTYHNLGMFFDRVSKVPRIINVSDIDIKAKDQPAQNSTISAECVATTFVLLETPPTAPAGATQPAATAGTAVPAAKGK